MFDFDGELAQRYGVFASYQTEAAPASIDYHGENPAAEFDRLLDHYATAETSVLDLGCGAGHTLCRLAPHVKQIWGVDQNEELLNATRLRAEHLGLSNAHTLLGSSYDPEALSSLPEATFDLAFSRRGPMFSQALVRTLCPDAILLQEVVSNLDGYPLGEVFGRWHNAPYAYSDVTVQLHDYANLGLFPVSCKEYFYEEYFRDAEHLAAFLTQVGAMLGPWWLPRSLPRRPFDPAQDQEALALYVRYNTTPHGVRVSRQRKILVLRRAA